MSAKYSAPIPKQLTGQWAEALAHSSAATGMFDTESEDKPAWQQDVLSESAFTASLRALKERSDAIKKDAEDLNSETTEP